MARRPAQEKVSASVHLRDQDWLASGVYHRGSRDYWDTALGCWLPGDPCLVEDVALRPDGHHGVLDADDLTPREQALVDESLILAAAEAAEDHR